MPKSVSISELSRSGKILVSEDGRPFKPTLPKPAVDLTPLVAAIERLITSSRVDQTAQLEAIKKIGAMCANAIPDMPEPARRWSFRIVRNKDKFIDHIDAERLDP